MIQKSIIHVHAAMTVIFLRPTPVTVVEAQEIFELIQRAMTAYDSMISALEVDYVRKNAGRAAAGIVSGADHVAINHFAIHREWVARKAASKLQAGAVSELSPDSNDERPRPRKDGQGKWGRNGRRNFNGGKGKESNVESIKKEEKK